MFKVLFSDKLILKLFKIKKKDLKLTELIKNKLILFKSDINHPSLRRHKLSGNLDNLWSISINKSIRMVYIEMKNEFYFVDIGTHDQVYKK
jgi:mRNA-degrading endonuclease YafQ of YafQ-DinJ toxin-antitoxin module